MITPSSDVMSLWFIFGIICGIISGAIAWAKHRSFIAWFFAGFFFSILGVLISAIISRNEKKCPKCGEFSPYGTEKCEFCGYEFIPSESEDSKFTLNV
ncbi:hypothetical protein Desaci_2026 [Desulfosporosinus acidiphilus SJ4]|uniref:Uncharacterized protein n=1 Tax=Desulfosporosinus acidiphilus (strain DSM 22704 / JCM 16185 / SJ4) TaxID=646529 RepID=I4D5C7_DESAJ|nr:zinc ribbon domain-containing protein [Desulfosporosinus acidiphilus]AFM41001.1 hypothetical protein Desaci_2026 [Desulfosporosinus acidiphilus SJ4]